MISTTGTGTLGVKLSSAVTLDAATTINSNGGAVTFSSTVNDSVANTDALTVTAGSGLITFTGNVGHTTALASLAATSSNQIKIDGSNTTGGTQTYTGPVVIGGNDTLTTTNSAVDFTTTVDDSASNTHSLTVSAGSGLITFGNTVGGGTKLGSLGATSTTDIDLYGSVTTGGSQTYTGPVVIGGNDTLTTTNSAVTFNSTVDDSTSNTHSLTVSAGSGFVTFGGTVGATNKLASLAATSTTGIDINGSRHYRRHADLHRPGSYRRQRYADHHQQRRRFHQHHQWQPPATRIHLPSAQAAASSPSAERSAA